ncbi:MAG: PAS domain S-box protein [Myxococcota bacterium]
MTSSQLLDEIPSELLDVVDEFARTSELEDVLRLAVRRLANLFELERASVVLFREDEDVGYVVLEHSNDTLGNLVVRLTDYPELQEVIRTERPIVIPDVLDDRLLQGVRSKIENAKNVHRSALLFPLVRKDRVVGALFLRGKELAQKIDDDLIAKGRLIAAVASISLGSALEQDDLRREFRHLLRTKEAADREVQDLRKFSSFFEQAHDGIVVTDAKGSILYLNDSAGGIFEADPSTLTGRPFVSLLSRRSHNLAVRALSGDNVGDGYGYVDLLVERQSSDEAVISVAMRVLEDGEQRLISFRDVTELREIESELRQTKDFLENLIQSSVDAIVAADVNGNVILFNKAAERILGYSASEVVGRMTADRLYPDGDYDDVVRRIRGTSSGGRGRLEPIRKDLLAKDGASVPVNLTAATIYEAEREVAFVGIFTDLRERMRIEEKLSQAQRQLQVTERQAVAIELAGTAAHELNQPLTSILGYAEMMKSRISEEDRNRKPIEVICRETERMAGIVRKIGQLTSYKTQPYVGGSSILDLD